MAGYVLNIGTASAKQWISFNYEKTLNGIGSSQIALDGVTNVYASVYDTDVEVNISKNGTLVFRGIVIGKENLTGGGVVLDIRGIEIQLADDKVPMVGTNLTRVFSSTTDNSIISTLVTSVSGWTVDVSNSSASTMNDFRVSATESVWNGVIRLINQTGKDIWIDQANKKVFLYDSLTRADQFSFVEGQNASNISRSKARSAVGKVLVYGKGDGEFQIIGSSGSSTPVEVIIDRNIINPADANARATVEFNRLNPNPLSFKVNPTNAIDSLLIGDAGKINNNSAGIDATVHIVRLKYSVNGNGTEKVGMEVTNPEFRIASKSVAEEKNRQDANYQDSNSSMQGSGNVSEWGSGINAKTNFPLKVGFQVSSAFMQDQTGDLRIASLTVDYDIDKFRSDIGTASFNGSDPQVQNVSGDRGAGLNGTMDDNDDFGVTDDGVVGGGFVSSPVHANFTNIGSFTNVSGAYTIFSITLIPDFQNSDYALRVHNLDTGQFYPSSAGIALVSQFALDFISINIVIPDNIVLDDLDLEMKNTMNGADLYILFQSFGEHKHGFGSMNADTHDHPRGGYDINAADIDNISVGDDVSEAGALNASSVNLYLDFFNTGTSNWDNKHSILNTGVTIDTDVDISNNGTYPDAVGFWRIRVEPITATADFAQGIVKLKYLLDN